MSASAPDQAQRILLALADLAPSGEQRTVALSVPTEWFRWLDAASVRLFVPRPYYEGTGTAAEAIRRFATPEEAAMRFASVDRTFAERLASVDQLRPEQRSLRVGWLFVAGRMKDHSARVRRVLHPLVTVPVRVDRAPGWGPARLRPAGDVEVSELIEDRQERYRLEGQIQLGGGALDGMNDVTIPPALLARLDHLQQFARSVASAARLPASLVVPATDGPEKLMTAKGLVIVAGVGVFATHETGTASRAGSLRAWAASPLSEWTAFHALYLDADPPAVANPEHSVTVESPYLLTPAQRDAIIRSRREHITVVSGAPGTGKSHTVVSIACDALSRGESVLVAAKSDATVDALLDLFERSPGPDPVVFGSSERREALANRLAAGQLQPISDNAVRGARAAHERARDDERSLRQRIADQLGAEELVTRSGASQDRARRDAPGFFDPATDLVEVERVLDAALSPARGWWRGRRRRRYQRSLLASARASADVPLVQLTEALRVARATHVASRLVVDGGLEIGGAWTDLRDLNDRARRATAEWLAADSRSDERLNRATLPTVAALATALRSGRAARRDQLSRLDRRLTRALPLWVGSLPDIDDLLPAVSGFFDLVILDEASSIDQSLAVPGLLRARRGVIVGDPQQLRHVSFLSDERLRSVIDEHGLDAHPMLTARLDVRRNSAFDLGAGVSPVNVLDEHFRSDPHLVEFVAMRLYGGTVKVATRAPTTTAKDCVSIVRLEGRRSKDGVVGAEVDAALQELVRLRRSGANSVGLITPFRAQADALEAAALRAFKIDDLEALDLRVGTVHAFQGNERDIVIASLGVGPEQDGSSWRFIEDPHLFTVLVTRARREMTILVSADPPPGGLVAEYLAQADSPPGDPPLGQPANRWVAELVDDLTAGGVAVMPSYPTGRHTIDICGRDGPSDVAIECGVHPGGPDEHIDRHLSLLSAGWQLLEAFPSRWSERRGELVVELLPHFKARDRRGR